MMNLQQLDADALMRQLGSGNVGASDDAPIGMKVPKDFQQVPGVLGAKEPAIGSFRFDKPMKDAPPVGDVMRSPLTRERPSDAPPVGDVMRTPERQAPSASYAAPSNPPITTLGQPPAPTSNTMPVRGGVDHRGLPTHVQDMEMFRALGGQGDGRYLGPNEGPAMQPASGTNAPAGGPSPTPQGRRGWNNLSLDAPTQRGINQFSGFNDDRALSGGDDDSVKDAFRRWAGGLDFRLQGASKEQIADHFRSQIDNARQYGLEILDVQGEKILINTKERGPEWIDAVQDAGGANPRFAWQSEYDHMGDAALGQRPQGPGAALQLGAERGPSAIDRILAEVEALQGGGASPMDNDALMQLLQQA